MRIARLMSSLPALALVILLMAGCQPSERSAGLQKTGQAGDAESAAWPFWPREVQIHPLTRFTRDKETGGLVIAARVEFLDAEGHNTKCWGQIRFDLHSAMQGQNPRSLQSWNEDLRDLANNRKRFDDVTRTYLFPLQVEESLMPARAMLKVWFLSTDGETMRAEVRLPER